TGPRRRPQDTGGARGAAVVPLREISGGLWAAWNAPPQAGARRNTDRRLCGAGGAARGDQPRRQAAGLCSFGLHQQKLWGTVYGRARACGASVPQGTGPLLRGAGYGLWFREGAPQGPHGLRCWPHGLRRELRTSRSLVICPHEDMRANFLVMTAFFECVLILWRTAKRDSSPAEKESGTKCPTAGLE